MAKRRRRGFRVWEDIAERFSKWIGYFGNVPQSAQRTNQVNSVIMILSPVLARRMPRALGIVAKSAGSTIGSFSTASYPVRDNSWNYDDVSDWDDRIHLQQSYSLKEKGWRVSVEWKITGYGVALFAAQDIDAGTLMRRGIVGENLVEFETPQDVTDFIDGDDSRMRYLKDYLFGLHTNTDERGFPVSSEKPFLGCWVPGNAANHNTNPNCGLLRTEEGVDLLACADISSGDEICDDYRRFGTAPGWVKEWAKSQGVQLTFPGCNDFV